MMTCITILHDNILHYNTNNNDNSMLLAATLMIIPMMMMMKYYINTHLCELLRGIFASTLKLGERGQDFQSTGDIEMSVYL